MWQLAPVYPTLDYKIPKKIASCRITISHRTIYSRNFLTHTRISINQIYVIRFSAHLVALNSYLMCIRFESESKLKFLCFTTYTRAKYFDSHQLFIAFIIRLSRWVWAGRGRTMLLLSQGRECHDYQNQIIRRAKAKEKSSKRIFRNSSCEYSSYSILASRLFPRSCALSFFTNFLVVLHPSYAITREL